MASSSAAEAPTHSAGEDGTGSHHHRRAPAVLIVLAFASLYFFWGSTYLGIKWAIEGFPPFFMAGVRNLVAGLIVYGWMRWRVASREGGRGFDEGKPTAKQWANAALVGGLLLLGGNGLVTFATQWIPSSLVALMVSMLPIWMAILEPAHDRYVGAQRGGSVSRISGAQWAGIVLGFVGVAMLIGPKVLAAFNGGGNTAGNGIGQALGALATLASSFCWANGSLYSRRADLPRSPLLSTGMQLLCGGALLLVVAVVAGELPRLSVEQMTASWRPIGALVYLIVAGSLIGFTSYIWLLGHVSPSKVATYAYINPMVAVGLGWWLGNEEMTWRILLAAAIIIAGVVIIVTLKGRKPPEKTVVPTGGTLAVPALVTGAEAEVAAAIQASAEPSNNGRCCAQDAAIGPVAQWPGDGEIQSEIQPAAPPSREACTAIRPDAPPAPTN